MAAIGTMVLANAKEFLHGIEEAKKLQLRFMRTEMKRGLQRVRKTFINTQLKGPPGIDAGKLAKGKNVFTFVNGDSLQSLGGKIGISRILHVHEKGLTITPRNSDRLFIVQGRGTAKEEVVATAESVTIPKRLTFRQHVVAQSPAVLKKVAQEGLRASEVALSNALKRSVARL